MATRQTSGVDATTIRPYTPADHARVMELSLAAWSPVFESFRAMLGDDLYRRVHPDWMVDQAASVSDALERNATWVSVTDGTVSGFVNVVFDTEQGSGEIHMIAVDPASQRQRHRHRTHGVGSRRDAIARPRSGDRRHGR